jgi:hypothetical protein
LIEEIGKEKGTIFQFRPFHAIQDDYLESNQILSFDFLLWGKMTLAESAEAGSVLPFSTPYFHILTTFEHYVKHYFLMGIGKINLDF